MSRVVFMMLDGVRPDALKQASTPNLDQLLTKSSYTMSAQAVMPSSTLPCHTSMFYSVLPEKHGITDITSILQVKHNGLIEQLKAANKKTVAFYNWDGLRVISRPLNMSNTFAANSASIYENGEFAGDRFIAEHATRELAKALYDFAFVYFGTVDECGHRFGWMSKEYMHQLEIIDGLVGEVLAILPEDTTVLVQSDHGGHDFDHGTAMPEDMSIPLFISGPNIKQNYEIKTSVNHLNIAPTLAQILGIEPASQWEGSVIEEIFSR